MKERREKEEARESVYNIGMWFIQREAYSFLTGDRNQSRFDPGLSLGNRTFLNPTVCIYQVGIIVLTPFHSLY